MEVVSNLFKLQLFWDLLEQTYICYKANLLDFQLCHYFSGPVGWSVDVYIEIKDNSVQLSYQAHLPVWMFSNIVVESPLFIQGWKYTSEEEKVWVYWAHIVVL